MCDGATTAGAENASVQATSLGWRYKRNPAVTASRVDLPPTQTEHSFAAIPFPLGPSQSLPRFQVHWPSLLSYNSGTFVHPHLMQTP